MAWSLMRISIWVEAPQIQHPTKLCLQFLCWDLTPETVPADWGLVSSFVKWGKYAGSQVLNNHQYSTVYVADLLYLEAIKHNI